MTEHPITPPPELVQQWMTEAHDQPPGPDARVIATQAARWGADQELEACCEWLPSDLEIDGQTLREHRRPKPPSLKEQALEAWGECWGSGFFVQKDSFADTIRRALEQLDD